MRREKGARSLAERTVVSLVRPGVQHSGETFCWSLSQSFQNILLPRLPSPPFLVFEASPNPTASLLPNVLSSDEKSFKRWELPSLVANTDPLLHLLRAESTEGIPLPTASPHIGGRSSTFSTPRGQRDLQRPEYHPPVFILCSFLLPRLFTPPKTPGDGESAPSPSRWVSDKPAPPHQCLFPSFP